MLDLAGIQSGTPTKLNMVFGYFFWNFMAIWPYIGLFNVFPDLDCSGIYCKAYGKLYTGPESIKYKCLNQFEKINQGKKNNLDLFDAICTFKISSSYLELVL